MIYSFLVAGFVILSVHNIEPHYGWRNRYISEEDPRSPFFEVEHSEFYFTDKIYNHYIHPQWDNMGSPTLFLKIIYCDYLEGFAIIELIGEWNDLLHNDIMYLKREIADRLLLEDINKFILVGENVLNFHGDDDDYYEEWFEDVEDGWIALLNFREHVLQEIQNTNIDYYFVLGGLLNEIAWRTYEPTQLFHKIESHIAKRLTP